MDAIIWCVTHNQELSKCTEDKCFMKEEKEIPKTNYEKILVSSGEVPEEEGYYDTDAGCIYFNKPGSHSKANRWTQEPDPFLRYFNRYPTLWYKPVPSPEGFAEWVACNFKQAKGANKTWIYKPKDFIGIGAADATIKDYFTISELYDKFKSDGKNL